MYRKRNGSLGFSFTRFANAAVPNFFADPPASQVADLTPLRHDMCYAHQTSSSNPYALDERSFYVSGICDTESLSRKVHKALLKNGILKEENGLVNTHAIGPRFMHQMAIISAHRQRELIGLLFWWEEECQRLKKLEGEEGDLNGMIKEAEKKVLDDGEDGDGGEREDLDRLRFARERVRMKRRQRPSQRDPEVEADRDDIVMAFHGQGRSKSVPNVRSVMGPNGGEERPPEYYAPMGK